MVWSVLVSLVRSRVSLEAEILILRHQLNIQRRHQPKRLDFSAMDRLMNRWMLSAEGTIGMRPNCLYEH